MRKNDAVFQAEESLIKQAEIESHPNTVTLGAMEASENGEELFGPFDSVSELMEALNA